MDYESYKEYWAKKTRKQVEKELASWEKYVNKHSLAYSWHGKAMTPPGALADGDKITALKEILRDSEAVTHCHTLSQGLTRLRIAPLCFCGGERTGPVVVCSRVSF